MSVDTVQLRLLRLLGFDRSGDGHEGIYSGEVRRLEQTAILNELADGEANGNQCFQPGVAIFFDFVAIFEPWDANLANILRSLVPSRKMYGTLTGNTDTRLGSLLEDDVDCYQRIRGS